MSPLCRENGLNDCSSPPANAPQKRRVPLWDNARWIAITLMVVGHAILKLISESDAAYAMYLFIYAFHVPSSWR